MSKDLKELSYGELLAKVAMYVAYVVRPALREAAEQDHKRRWVRKPELPNADYEKHANAEKVLDELLNRLEKELEACGVGVKMSEELMGRSPLTDVVKWIGTEESIGQSMWQPVVYTETLKAVSTDVPQSSPGDFVPCLKCGVKLPYDHENWCPNR